MNHEGLGISIDPKVNVIIFIAYAEGGREVFRIDGDGRIFWNKREVITDDHMRASLMDLRDVFIKKS